MCYAQQFSNQEDYIQYTQEVEQIITHLEHNLHDTDDPDEIIMRVLIAATAFYDADSAYIIEADLTSKLWTKKYGYVCEDKEETNIFCDEIQEGDYLLRWINSLKNGIPLIIEDVGSIAETNPAEHKFFDFQ